MATICKDGIKFDKNFWPFVEEEECTGCRFLDYVGEADGQDVDRHICKMPPEFEDKFLFNDLPDEEVPPCFKE